MLFFQNISTNPIISQIYFLLRHTLELYGLPSFVNVDSDLQVTFYLVTNMRRNSGRFRKEAFSLNTSLLNLVLYF